MFLIGILPILQALACGFTIWGGIHTLQTTDTIVQYGAGADGPTPAEWMNSFGSLAIGLFGFVSTQIMKKRAGGTTEFMAALAMWIANRQDPAATRRLAFAAMDWIEQCYVANVTDPEDKAWWQQMIALFRGRFAAPVVFIAPANAIPTK